MNFEAVSANAPAETPAPQTVTVRFLPDDISVEAMPGDSLLRVAHEAGIDIPTGCLRGSCHACEVGTDVWGPVCSCIAAVPPRSLTVELWQDPTW
ncbi:MAG: 2Fe-2S iron-sulfur cluster binding domain-containing protein [Cyanobacteria bacterium J06639_1]